MDDALSVRADNAGLLRAADTLLACNARTARYGLTLSGEAALALCARRAAALSDTGRVELSHSILAALIDAFCDSPYLMQEDYETTLGDLAETFFTLKNDTRDLLADDELLSAMRACYDAYGGSVDAVAGISADALLGCRSIGELYGGPADELGEGDDGDDDDETE